MGLVDRSGWAKGEWDNEPDRMEYRIGDYWCCANRTQATGCWCGYVGVPKGHRWWGKHYDDIESETTLDAHGGLTYARPSDSRWGQPANLYVVGFDCAHAGDYCPAIGTVIADDTYRNLPYVLREIRRLYRSASGDAEQATFCLFDGERATIYRYPLHRTITGDGAAMVKRWIRFEDAHIGVIADWLDEHPQSVEGLAEDQLHAITHHLRKQVGLI